MISCGSAQTDLFLKRILESTRLARHKGLTTTQQRRAKSRDNSKAGPEMPAARFGAKRAAAAAAPAPAPALQRQSGMRLHHRKDLLHGPILEFIELSRSFLFTK